MNISESKKYKDLLHEAEKAVRMGAYELDVTANKLLWTEELYRIYEVPSDFVPTVNKVINMYEKKSRTEIRKLVSTALKSGKGFDTELELITPGKKTKWVRATGSVKKVKSKISKLIGTVQDITAQKNAELQIQRLAWVASHTSNAVIISDKYGLVEWVNHSFEKLMGYKLFEVKGKHPEKFLHGPETDKETEKRIISRLKKGLHVSEILINYSKAKKPIWIKLDLSPIFSGKEIINFVAIISDLTELINAKEIQKTQEALIQSRKLLDAMAINFPDGIIGVIDKNLNYLFVGGSELSKLGHRRRDLLGDKIFDKISLEADKYSEPFLKRTFKGEHVSFEVKINDDTYSVNAVPLKRHDDPVEHSLVVIQNITNRKNTEEEILRALVQQRELNELKSKFVSIASHEFRTPLSTILSSVFLIEQYNKPGDEERRQKHVNRIKQSVSNLTDILNDFLSLGKFEEGSVRNNPSTFNAVALCNEVTDEMQPTLKEGQTIKFIHDKRDFIIFLDRLHLKNALINLLSNASKYSAEGKTIQLELVCEKNEVLFRVKDEGIGIPGGEQNHLFQTFYRASNAINIQGTGMGLHIVKKYLDLMGGSISFKSKLNTGSIFTIKFPHAASHASASE